MVEPSMFHRIAPLLQALTILQSFWGNRIESIIRSSYMLSPLRDWNALSSNENDSENSSTLSRMCDYLLNKTLSYHGNNNFPETPERRIVEMLDYDWGNHPNQMNLIISLIKNLFFFLIYIYLFIFFTIPYRFKN